MQLWLLLKFSDFISAWPVKSRWYGGGGGGQADHFMEYFLSPLSDTWVMIPDQYVLEKDLTRLNSGDLTGINQQFGFQSI